MQNVAMTVKDSVLTIKVDLSKSFGLSKSGKTTSIASTKGNVPVPGHENARIGVNVYEYPEKK